MARRWMDLIERVHRRRPRDRTLAGPPLEGAGRHHRRRSTTASTIRGASWSTSAKRWPRSRATLEPSGFHRHRGGLPPIAGRSREKERANEQRGPGAPARALYGWACAHGGPPHPPFGHLLPGGEKGMVDASAQRGRRGGAGKRSPSPRGRGERGGVRGSACAQRIREAPLMEPSFRCRDPDRRRPFRPFGEDSVLECIKVQSSRADWHGIRYLARRRPRGGRDHPGPRPIHASRPIPSSIRTRPDEKTSREARSVLDGVRIRSGRADRRLEV